jgi:hypothetical protein
MKDEIMHRKYIASMPWLKALLSIKIENNNQGEEKLAQNKENYAFLSEMIPKCEELIGKSILQFTDDDKDKVWQEFFE